MTRRSSNALALSLAAALSVSFVAGCGSADDRKAAYFKRGVELLEQGDLVKARLELKNALQIDAKYAPAWLKLGEIDERGGNLQAAFNAYARAVELDPANVEARLRRGRILLAAGQLDQAQADVDAVLQATPDSAEGLVLRGALRQRKGDKEGAMADARAALAREPGQAAASSLLALLLHESGKPDEAQKLLEGTVAAHPDDLGLKLLLGRLYEERGNTDAVVATLESAAALAPDNAELRKRLAQYLVKLDRKADAERLLRDAVAAKPADVERRVVLLEFVTQTKGTPAAIEEVAAMQKALPEAVKLRFAEAALHRAAKDWAKAEAVYRGVIASQPTGPDGVQARVELAALLLGNNQADKAEPLLGEALAASPNETGALKLRALIALAKREPDPAITDLRAVLREKPEDVTAQLLLGQAHVLKGDLALAQEAYEKAIAAAPTEPAAYLALAELRVRGGDPDGAEALLEKLLAKAPDNAAAQQAIARIQLSEQDWTAAEETAKRIRTARPDHPLGYYLEGLAQQRRGELEASVKSFDKALELKPGAAEPLVALARSEVQLKRPDRAAERLEAVLAKEPTNFTALSLSGVVAMDSGQPGIARERFEALVRAYPKSSNSYLLLSTLLARQSDREGAVKVLRDGVERTGRNTMLVLQLAGLLEALGDAEGAIPLYEEVLQLNPKSDPAANNLAVLLVNHRPGPESLDRAYELARRFESSDRPEFRDTLGWVLYLRGDYPAAVPHLEKAVAKADPQPEIHYHLGMAYLKAGRTAEAKAQLTQALTDGKTYPWTDDARNALAQIP